MSENIQKKPLLTRRNVLIGLAILLAVVLIALIVFLITARPAPPDSAIPRYTMTIDGAAVAPEELGYFYGLAINQYINDAYYYWGDDASGIIRFSLDDGIISLQTQACPLEGYQDKMWSDYFMDKAAQTLFEVSIMAQAAESKGVALETAELADIEQQLADMQTYCATSGITVDEYLLETFGPGVTYEWVREKMKTTSLVAKYVNQLAEELEATPEQPEAYYGAVDGLLASHSYDLQKG